MDRAAPIEGTCLLALTLGELIFCLITGALGGLLGGFLGIGGSLVMIPMLAVYFGPEDQHLYQAAAMIVNLFVALAAVIRHRRAAAVRVDALKGMIPSAIVLIIIGVLVSNQFPGEILARLFAIFLVYVILMNTRKLIYRWRHPLPKGVRRNATEDAKENPIPLPKSVFVGSVMGFMAGLLGIGGGGVAVPMQQVVFRIPLKQCIGTSTAVICVTAGIGAFVKNLTLDQAGAGFSVDRSLLIASALVPGAIVGSFLGAILTHRLPNQLVRLVFIILMIVAAAKMSGLWD
ncbi:MAG: sulfite exporter TauE/SafE family protein [Phycisphaerales bacterium]